MISQFFQELLVRIDSLMYLNIRNKILGSAGWNTTRVNLKFQSTLLLNILKVIITGAGVRHSYA